MATFAHPAPEAMTDELKKMIDDFFSGGEDR